MNSWFRHCNECDTRLHGRVDRISQLPDEIIIVILSFLSVREAAATSVLSSRWSDMWKRSPNLDFNTYCFKINTNIRHGLWDVKKCKYIKLVNSVIQSHIALSLKEFRVSFYVDKSGKCAVTNWLKFVFSRQVERLELDFLCMDGSYMVVLEELLRESRILSIFFKSLKSLCLRHMKVSGEDIKLFLHNCPLLERLVIDFADLTSDIEVCGGTDLMLKHLGISRCQGRKSIKVFAPNLTRLGVDNAYGKLLLENVPKVVEVDFTYTSPIPITKDQPHFASVVSCCISQLKILNLHLTAPKVFLANGFPEIPNLEKLVVKYVGLYEHSVMPVAALIWACPGLREFKLQFMGVSKDPEPRMGVVTNVESSPHPHLKVFEFREFGVGVGAHMELVTFVLDNCVALQKIIVGCKRFFPTYYPDISSVLSEIEAKGQTLRGYAKQQLQSKVPHHIKLHLV